MVGVNVIVGVKVGSGVRVEVGVFVALGGIGVGVARNGTCTPPQASVKRIKTDKIEYFFI
jgi:hypothetical protein